MAKTLTDQSAASARVDAKKQRKKQARREAKLALKVEQAKKAVQKAEQKIHKAHSSLEDRKTRLHKLEEKLSETHNQHQSANGSEPVPLYTLSEATSAPPVEGRDDLAEPASTNDTAATDVFDSEASTNGEITDAPHENIDTIAEEQNATDLPLEERKAES